MRKFILLFSAFSLAIGLAACSNTKTDSKETKETAAPKTDVKKELVKFYMDLGNKINAKDSDLNSYEALVAKAAEDPSVTIEADQKTKASESAAAVATELKSFQIPSGLKEQKTDLEAALKDYSASYQAKAEELKKDAPSLDAADATFAQGEEKLGKVYKAAKLLPPSLGKQVNE